MGLFFEHWNEEDNKDISIGAYLLSSDYRVGKEIKEDEDTSWLFRNKED